MFGDWLIFRVSQKRLANHSAIFLGGAPGEELVIHAAEKIGVIKEQLLRWEKYLAKAYRLFEVELEVD